MSRPYPGLVDISLQPLAQVVHPPKLGNGRKDQVRSAPEDGSKLREQSVPSACLLRLQEISQLRCPRVMSCHGMEWNGMGRSRVVDVVVFVNKHEERRHNNKADAMEWDGIRWDGVRWERDGKGWDGMHQLRTEWHGMARNGAC